MAADNPAPRISLIILGCFVAIVALAILLAPHDSSAPETPATTPQKMTPLKPMSLAERIRAIAKSAADDGDISDLNYEGVNIVGYDDPDADVPQPTGMWDAPIEKAPKGALDLFVNYHLPQPPTADDDAARYTAALYQKLFALNPAVWRVTVNFNSPMTDDYGHTDDHTYIGYTMYRPTFRKIDWRGFETASLCRFLRDEGNGDLAADGDPKGGDICDLWPGITSLGIVPLK